MTATAEATDYDAELYVPTERDVTVRRRSVPMTLTFMAWATIGPAVLLGLLATVCFASLVLHIEPETLLWTAVFGGTVMIACAIPGQLAYGATLRRKVIRPLADITSQVQSLSRSVSAAATSLSSAAEQVSTSSVDVGTAVNEIALGAEHQSRKIEATCAWAESISRSINNVALGTDETRQIGQEAKEAAAHGQQATVDAISTITDAQQAIEILASSVEVLTKRSKNIASIVDIISSIADQTNLLSVNASIEAARAGDMGRGFAVVAERVGKLADGSSNAARDIGALVSDILDDTAALHVQMRTGLSMVISSAKAVAKAGETLQKITDSTTRTAGLTDEIAEAISAQAEEALGIEHSLHDIAMIVQQSAAAAEETAAATSEQVACTEEIMASAQELADMAQELAKSALHLNLE
ncbi:MAG: methyl-accepting chemotaxis protein [Coriobacteriia bacterium]|nr:methyl-accepting chemotaxis protein [Coriobacteriia bacterium]